jgi:hypothetical protein
LVIGNACIGSGTNCEDEVYGLLRLIIRPCHNIEYVSVLV